MVGNRLKQCRTAKGWSVKELAEKSGVCCCTIRDIERKGPVLNTILPATMRKLSAALGLTPYQVFPDAKRTDRKENDNV